MRSKFSLSNYKLCSIDGGILYPVGLTEVLPGDTIQQNTNALIRVAPMLAPIMHPVHVRIHHWYVPHRLVWEDWEDFITGGPDGMDDAIFPTITINAAVGSTADFLGVPTGTSIAVSALPFRGYAAIFNEWYRDQDLVTESAIDLTSGVDTTTNVNLRRIAWEKDYFTSARPWEQKGPSITLPLGTTAPVVTTGVAPTMTVNGTSRTMQTGPLSGVQAMFASGATFANANQAWANPTGLQTNLAGASAITVNALREALALQRFEEARARYGSRYVEYLRYLGVRSSDARLQRPEYLGGGSQTVQFSEVLQTAEGTNPVGTMKGHGIASMRSNRFRRYIEEHGYVFTMLSVRPKTMYMNGLPRHFNRRVKEDFWQKELQHIGQQEILNKEVYIAHATPDGTFGYQDRYDEYRRSFSTVAGEFRTTDLNYWHMARDFSSDPALNGSFVESTPTTRVFAATLKDQYYVMAKHSIQARRLVAGSGSSFIF